MRSFIEFYNVREEERLQEIFQTLAQGAGQTAAGIAQAAGQAAGYGADVRAAYQGGQYTPIKRAIDSFKELDGILKELGYGEDVLKGLQDIRAQLEQPQQPAAGV